jgi:hypothetical protein
MLLSAEFPPSGEEEGVHSTNNNSNKSLPANVHVRIRGGIVHIPVRHAIVRTVVPIPAQKGKRASQIPYYR